ncbi:hypothetical protein MHBO_000387 [Bonamia ostreae]|uniref:Uncharacterized protein n=1 Tax=Bonamia ostreae TaxID=126728 RepID=A0ABV2AG40_9EUKA
MKDLSNNLNVLNLILRFPFFRTTTEGLIIYGTKIRKQHGQIEHRQFVYRFRIRHQRFCRGTFDRPEKSHFVFCLKTNYRFGHSLGTVPALFLASNRIKEQEVAAIVVLSGFSSGLKTIDPNCGEFNTNFCLIEDTNQT